MAKAISRRQARVNKLLVEINHTLYERLEKAVNEYGMYKRDIVSEALLIWLNRMDNDKSKRVV